MAVNPLVSICIPAYNGAAYLEACLDSCVGQTFRDYEILVCDDGSSDNTVAIVKKYAEQHTYMRLVVNERNLGLVGNWNKCIELAQGRWIKFVFQDDYISADCLEKFTTNINEETRLMVSARHFVLPDNASPEQLRYYRQEVRTLENTTTHRDAYFPPALISKIAVKNICMNFIGEPSLTFFRKDLVQELGYFENALKQICDLEFFLRIATVHGLVYLPQTLCAFRVHAHSTTSSNIKHKFFELHYVEPIVFTWFLLYHDWYKMFRAHLSVAQRLKLSVYFKAKVFAAYQVNVKEQRNHFIFEAGQQRFKEVSVYKSGSLLIQLITWLRR